MWDILHAFKKKVDPEFSQKSLTGLDLSHWNGHLDFNKLKKNIDFIYIKATEGITKVDEMLVDYTVQSMENNIPFGYYHFFHANLDGTEQAQHFLKHIYQEKMNLLPVLDWEVSDGMPSHIQIQEAQKWLDVVEESTGKKPMIYTGPSFFEDLKAPPSFREYPLWVAHYGVDKPWIPKPFNKYLIHQWTENGKISGFKSDFDFNMLNGTLEDLKL